MKLVVLFAAVLLPTSAAANAVIHVKCTDSCKIKIDGKRGEKVSDSEWKYDQLEAGIYEVEVSRGYEGGWADIPADGEVQLQVSKDDLLVNGQKALDKKGKKALEKQREKKADADKEAREKQEKQDKEQAKRAKEKANDKEKDARSAAGRTKLAVVKLLARTGIDQPLADLYCDALVGELRKRPGIMVTDRNDVSTAIGADRERQLLGCDSAGCIAEIGGALGVEQLVHGTVGRVGKSLLVNLTLVDSKKAVAVAAVSERLKNSSDEAFFDALPDLVDQLLKKK